MQTFSITAMRVFLIYPPTSNMLRTLLPPYVEQEIGAYPPLGLASIAAFLRREGEHTVEILDAPAEGMGVAEVAQRIGAFAPDVVGITANTFMLLDAAATARAAREAAPGSLVCVGGPHASVYPTETAALPGVDCVLAGEGERAFARLVEAHQASVSPAAVPGFHGADGAQGPPATPIDSLDDLPFPARDLLPNDRYASVQGQESSMTTMFTSRGCPFDCRFCFHAFGRRLRKRSPENVVRELRSIRDLGIRDAFIFDDTFTADRSWVLEVCQLLEAERLDLVFDVRARVDTVDEELLGRLRAAGCERISYGVEAGNDRTLAYLRKKITVEDARRVVTSSKRLGFTVFADFMIASPCETRRDVLETIDFALDLDPHFAQFSATIPYPATDLYAEFLASDIDPGDYWRDFARDPRPGFQARFFNRHMDEAEILALLQLAYHRFYWRGRFVWERLKRLRSPRKFAAYLKAAMRLLLRR